MDQKRTKWRLDGYAWVISKIEECSDLDEMLETMPMKFERKRTWGKHLTRNNKHYVQNEWDSGRQEEEEEPRIRRKQGNRNCNRNAIVSQRCACNDAVFLRVERKSFSRTIQSNLYEVFSFCNIGDR